LTVSDAFAASPPEKKFRGDIGAVVDVEHRAGLRSADRRSSRRRRFPKSVTTALARVWPMRIVPPEVGAARPSVMELPPSLKPAPERIQIHKVAHLVGRRGGGGNNRGPQGVPVGAIEADHGVLETIGLQRNRDVAQRAGVAAIAHVDRDGRGPARREPSLTMRPASPLASPVMSIVSEPVLLTLPPNVSTPPEIVLLIVVVFPRAPILAAPLRTIVPVKLLPLDARIAPQETRPLAEAVPGQGEVVRDGQRGGGVEKSLPAIVDDHRPVAEVGDGVQLPCAWCPSSA
jgi:hypothetical protein